MSNVGLSTVVTVISGDGCSRCTEKSLAAGVQSHALSQRPGLWLPSFPLLWLPQVFRLAVYLGLCLTVLVLLPVHSFLPPLGSHGVEVSKNTVLRLR